MTRTLGFLASIVLAASVGAAAENHSPRTRSLEDHTAIGRQPAALEVGAQQVFRSLNSSVTSTSQPAGGPWQASAVEQPRLASGGEADGSGPNAANRRARARGETSATAPDSSGRETTPPGDPAVEDVREESAAAAGQLPQTSTILPLLGLIGLGSLVAGFFARR